MSLKECPICKGSGVAVKSLGIKCELCNGQGEWQLDAVKRVKPGNMTPAIAENYMREWMGLRAVKLTQRTEDALFFTANKERYGSTRFATDNKREYMVLTAMDSENQYDVHSRPVGGTDLEWEWVDAITEQSDGAIEDEKSWEGIR